MFKIDKVDPKMYLMSKEVIHFKHIRNRLDREIKLYNRIFNKSEKMIKQVNK